MDVLKLYRGDAQKIKQFEFTKTDKHCWVGRGVYLTNNLDIAHSYRTKGTCTRQAAQSTLFSGLAKDRSDALDKAFDSYFNDYLYNNNLMLVSRGPKQDKAREALKAKVRAEFDERVADRKIVAEYTRSSPDKWLTVTQSLEGIIGVGYVTEFVFPKHTFEASIVHVEQRPIKDTLFWELLWDAKFKDFGYPADTREEFLRLNTAWDHWSIPKRDAYKSREPDVHNRMRSILQPYGYRGYEYYGGVATGGKRHRAFCIWDEEFVNDHKVRRFT